MQFVEACENTLIDKYMKVFLQQDRNADVFLKQLLDIGPRKVAVDISTGLITLSVSFL